MTTGPTIRAGGRDDAGPVAAIHADRIAEGFLVTLGPRFLARLYRRIARSPEAVLVVAEEAGVVVGFAAATTSTRRLYADFLRRDAVPAALAAAPAIVRRPRQVWETLRYGTAGPDDLPPAEILSIAVHREAGGRGVGGALLAATLLGLRRVGADSARVVTAESNDVALALYQRAGFRRAGRTEVHPGVGQEILVWP